MVRSTARREAVPSACGVPDQHGGGDLARSPDPRRRVAVDRGAGDGVRDNGGGWGMAVASAQAAFKVWRLLFGPLVGALSLKKFNRCSPVVTNESQSA